MLPDPCAARALPTPTTPGAKDDRFPEPAHLTLRRRLQEAAEQAVPAAAPPPRRLPLRSMALGLLGLSLGAGIAVIGVSLSQANDREEFYATIRQSRPAHSALLPSGQRRATYTSASSYAARPHQPLGATTSGGLIQFPAFEINPFKPAPAARAAKPRRSRGAAALTAAAGATTDIVSGASQAARTICVRLCDGYQYPIGQFDSNADLAGHEALCQATFPGVPTRVFRVAAGAATIDDAVDSQNRTYRSLPMAHAYKTSIDLACARPRTGERTVSLLRDFTLRPGDAVVLDGRVRVFNGSRRFPYRTSDFRDFRQSKQLTAGHRQRIDRTVGISMMEARRREARRLGRVREANIPTVMSDARRPGVAVFESVSGTGWTGARVIRVITP